MPLLVRIYEIDGSYVDLNPGLMNVLKKWYGKQRGCLEEGYVGPRLAGKKEREREKYGG